MFLLIIIFERNSLMIHDSMIRKAISACAILLALVAVVTPSRSQITTNSAVAHPAPGMFYLKIGGLSGPAKGYINRSIPCHGFNAAVNLPDRLKAGTYYIQFVDAGGRAVPGMTGSSVIITSKPKAAPSGLASGQRMHEPIRITKEIDKSSPLNFTIAPGDVDGDGMLDVMMVVKPQGASLLPPPNTSQQVRGTTEQAPAPSH
jgi:hypothetical protein